MVYIISSPLSSILICQGEKFISKEKVSENRWRRDSCIWHLYRGGVQNVDYIFPALFEEIAAYLDVPFVAVRDGVGLLSGQGNSVASWAGVKRNLSKISIYRTLAQGLSPVWFHVIHSQWNVIYERKKEKFS